jgi:hypothetical protein
VQSVDRVVKWVEKKIGLDRQPVSEGEEAIVISDDGDLPGCVKFVSGWFNGVLNILLDILASKGENAGPVVSGIRKVTGASDVNV